MVWPLKKRTPTAAHEVSPSLETISSLGTTLSTRLPENLDALSASSGTNSRSVATASIPGAYVVPSGYRIKGAIFTTRPVVVHGELSGPEVRTSQLFVTPGGQLRAPATVDRAVIGGLVAAPLVAREVVEVLAGGLVSARLESRSLKVLPGGVIAGVELSVGA